MERNIPSFVRIRARFPLGRRIVCAALVTAMLASAAALAEQPASRAVNGTLAVEQNVRVLRVWGNPYEQGFAHGYLLGSDILGLFEHVILDPRVMPEPAIYESVVRTGFAPRIALSDDEQAELSGLFDGIRERVGSNGLQLERLKRPLDLNDLIALNSLSDWIPMACSSFAAWGERTADGGTIVGRNLDYLDLPGITQQHLLVVHAGQPAGKKRFASIAWPAVIGAYTAMNEDGVFVAMHDAPAGRALAAMKIVPRSLALRRIVETVQADSAADDALKLLRAAPAFRGNNFLVAAPFHQQANPAVVFEYDGNAANGGVTMRTTDSAANKTPPGVIACTNHYRQRTAPEECNRYAAIAEELNAAAAGNVKLDAERAFATIGKAGVRITLQTVVAQLNAKTMEVHLATADLPATKVGAAKFSLDDLWRGVPAASASATKPSSSSTSSTP